MQTIKPIAALRDDGASQRCAQHTLEGAKTSWQVGAGSALIADLALYGAGKSLDDCPELLRLFQSPDFAMGVVSRLINPMSEALGRNPIGQIPFRHQLQNGIGVLQLALSGNAVLSLVLYEQRDISPPLSVCFADSECWEMVLIGAGKARLFELDEGAGPARINQRDAGISAGDALRICGFQSAKQIVSIDRSMVVLRLSRTHDKPMQSREYRLNDGTVLHRAMGDRKESRQEMFVTLLGAMGRKDAVPVFQNIAGQGGDQLRWQALRNCLALDSAAGFRELCAVAGNPDDDLAASAAALKAQLLAAYPQFARLETASCPA